MPRRHIRGKEALAPLILDLGIWWNWVVSLKSKKRNLWCPLNMVDLRASLGVFWRRGKSLVPTRNWNKQRAIHYRHILHFFWWLGSTTPPKKQKSANNLMPPPPPAKSMFGHFLCFYFLCRNITLLLIFPSTCWTWCSMAKRPVKLDKKNSDPPTLEGSKWCSFILTEICKTAKYQLKCLSSLLF